MKEKEYNPGISRFIIEKYILDELDIKQKTEIEKIPN